MKKLRLNNIFNIEQLEPRLLFSADVQPVPFDGGLTDTIILDTSPFLETSLVPGSIESHNTVSEEHQSRELIFIDAGVPDYQQLLDDLSARHNRGNHSDTLAGYQDLDAVHVVSHGADGSVQLGNARLTNDTLDAYAISIEGWQEALTDKADLLFYGCDLASGDEGRSPIEILSFLTGADIAASTDLTGAKALGGDWVLEYTVGGIESNVAVSAVIIL
jgi:hypothetical protein